MTEVDNAPDGSIAATKPENNLVNTGDRRFLEERENYDGPEYTMIPIPDEADRPMFEWSPYERRAYLLKQIMKYGHADNLPRSQRDYASDFGVSQPVVHDDIKRLRDYIAATSGRRVVSDTETVAQKAVKQLLEDEEWKQAWKVQREYTEWLFELGGDIGLDRAPDKKQVESYNISADATESLSDEEREQFDKLAQMATRSDDDGDDVIEVEATEVDDD